MSISALFLAKETTDNLVELETSLLRTLATIKRPVFSVVEWKLPGYTIKKHMIQVRTGELGFIVDQASSGYKEMLREYQQRTSLQLQLSEEEYTTINLTVRLKDLHSYGNGVAYCTIYCYTVA